MYIAHTKDGDFDIQRTGIWGVENFRYSKLFFHAQPQKCAIQQAMAHVLHQIKVKIQKHCAR